MIKRFSVLVLVALVAVGAEFKGGFWTFENVHGLKGLSTPTVKRGDMAFVSGDTDAFYRYSDFSTATGDDDAVVEPTNSSGRWIKVSSSEGGGATSPSLVDLTYAANISLNFATNSSQWLVLAGNVTFTGTGYARSGVPQVVLSIDADGSDRTITCPSGWRWMSGTNTITLGAYKIGTLTVWSRSTQETNVVASWISE